MSGTGDDYLSWLYSQVALAGCEYQRLVYHLYNTEFTWTVPNDGNRLEDALALRYEFAALAPRDLTETWLTAPCSVLEVLVALARRLEHESEQASVVWFWEMLQNLDLTNHTDASYRQDVVSTYLDVFVNRRYASNGVGGLFPLHQPPSDQRQVELWYQAAAYILESY